MRLVLRLIHNLERDDWHVCAAREEFEEDSIVTLEALCGRWVFGALTRKSGIEWLQSHRGATICPSCLAVYLNDRDLYH